MPLLRRHSGLPMVQVFGISMETGQPQLFQMAWEIKHPLVTSLGLGCMLSEGPIQKRLRVKEYKGCICAEFVMKSLRQAFMKLEREVQHDFALRGKRQGVELPKPKLPDFLSDEQVAAAKSPAGMARTLRDDGLVTERAQPKLLGEILDYRAYDMDEALSL